MSVALFCAAGGAIAGLLLGGMMFLLSLVGAAPNFGRNPQGAGLTAGIGLGMLIFAPIMYGVLGFIGGLINGLVYNVVASFSGGIELEVERN